jgi:arylsulfatase A-like enzyme
MLGMVSGASATMDASPARPNIVLILTDDEDLQAHTVMAKTHRLIGEAGAVFDNYFVTYPFCCPSRATTLRGQYGHNHLITGNIQPSGGAEKFRMMGHEASTIATWLDDAGYHTAFFGKYMNGYRPAKHGVPEGWDDWYAGSSMAHPSYNYVLNENGRLVEYGSEPLDYLTDVLARKANQVIRAAAGSGTPFFLYVAPFTPHSPATPAPRHEHMFTDTEMPRSPSFNEADVSDKPGIIRDLLQIEPDEIAQIEETYRKRLRSMLAIDDLVEGIVNTLEETGELNNTYIVYTSDNGYHLGTHRMIAGKTTPYEEDIAVPFVIRGPGVPAGVQIDVLVVNNDLAPSFAAMAGIEPPAFVDGRSFLPLFSEPDQPWRQVFAIERRALENHQLTGAAYYNGLRTADLTYVEYGSGERELYDHASDPYQLGNLAGEAPSDILEALSQRLAQLVQCAGSECRRLEDLPVDHTWTPPAPVAELPVLPAVPLVPEKDEKQLN